MNIPASKILQHIDPSATCVSIRTQGGDKCREITLEDLKALIASEYVIGIKRARGKLREIRLTVPPDVAFRELGETRAKVKDQLHTDASLTVIGPNAAHKTHHREHCRAWRDTEKRDKAVIDEFLSGARTGDIERSFRLPWTGPDSLIGILTRHGISPRRGKRPAEFHSFRINELGTEIWESVERGIERMRAFRPFSRDERIELYRRTWGLDWQASVIGL